MIKAERFAYNELELKPWEFGSLTPREFGLLRIGFYRRRRRRLEDEARWIATLVNHYPMRGKNAKTLREEQLIGYSEEQIAELDKKRNALRRKA